MFKKKRYLSCYILIEFSTKNHKGAEELKMLSSSIQYMDIKLWSTDKQLQHHLRTCWKHKI